MGNNPWDKERRVTSYGDLQLGRSSKVSAYVPERPAPEGEGWRNTGLETSQEMGVLARRSCRFSSLTVGSYRGRCEVIRG